MSRFREISIDFDEHTILVAKVSPLPQAKLEYESFKVITHISGLPYDVTSSISEATLERWREAYRMEIFEKYKDLLYQAPFGETALYDWDNSPEAS